ncbi:MAG: toll/interleukin-1 receptor domain-containing protein [Gordonia sp. (in: high G+C Gram-positive bacteria)]|uniref:toll/interleukin-1 receptor domain-containing protein n=1 Tax=Gordonia sp. (in: high G+C Gram-positive bacteria) TaxID=84139 RepID=UPI0039E455BD
MADIAISYSHRDVDFVRLIEARARAAGHTVWLDDPSDRGEYGAGMTLPSGQNHWDVISREFVNATAVVVLRTPSWEGSEYCCREWDLLTEWGKWTACATPNDIRGFDQLLADFGRYAPVADAHARLVDAARHGRDAGSVSLFERLLSRSEATDAQRVVDEALAAPWQMLTPALDPYLREVLDRRNAGRKRLRRAAITSVSILSVLALLSVVAWVIALFAQRSAQENADRSRALALVARSETESDTLKAVAQAEEAVKLYPTAQTNDALAVARSRDSRLRTGSVRSGTYVSLVLAPGTRRAAGVGLDEIHVFDPSTGAPISTIADTTGPRFGALVFALSGEELVYIDTKRNLIKRPVDGGGPQILASGVQTLAADGDRIWWSTVNDLISSDYAGQDRTTTPLETPLNFLTVDSEQQLADAIDSGGSLVTFELDSGRAKVRSARKIGGGDKAHNPNSRVNPVATRCGDRVFGSIANYRMRLRGTDFLADSTGISVKRASSSNQPPLCFGNDALVAGVIGAFGTFRTFDGAPVPLLRQGTVSTDGRGAAADENQSRFALARGDDGRVYGISPEGSLRSFEPASAATVARTSNQATDTTSGDKKPSDAEAAEIIAAAEVGGGIIGFDKIGRLISLDDGRVLAESAGTVAPNLFAVNDSGMAIATMTRTLFVDQRRVLVRGKGSGAPGELVGLTSAGDGRRFVATYIDHVNLVNVRGEVERTYNFPWSGDDQVIAAAVSPDGREISVGTFSGRVALIRGDEEPVFLKDDLTASASTQLAFTSKGDLLAVTPEGQLLRLKRGDGVLEVDKSVLFGASAVMLHSAGNRILVTGNRTDSAVYRADDLGVITRVNSGVAAPYSVQFGAGRNELIGLGAGGLVRVPLSE